MRDPFDYQFELLADDLIQESADARRSRKGWYVTFALVVLAAVVLLWAILQWDSRNAQQNMGSDPGVLQDGVYYFYYGSGLNKPVLGKGGRGIAAYTPGQEPELLVSNEDYDLETVVRIFNFDMVIAQWEINSHSLYFLDQGENALWRMDLESRETTLLYDLAEAEPPQDEMSWVDVLLYYTRGEVPEQVEYSPYLSLSGLSEEQVILSCSDGYEAFTLALDSRTGDVLSQVDGMPPSLSNGGETSGMAQAVQKLGLREGGPFQVDGVDHWYGCVAMTDRWLFYKDSWPNENPAIATFHTEISVIDVETGETYPFLEEALDGQVVTDGTWFYVCKAYTTDCYKLEYSPEGVPCGLTLIEDNL